METVGQQIMHAVRGEAEWRDRVIERVREKELLKAHSLLMFVQNLSVCAGICPRPERPPRLGFLCDLSWLK